VAVTNKWVLAGAPGLLGYTGIVPYLPTTRTTVVVLATAGPHSPPGTHYAGAIFDAVDRILAPGRHPPSRLAERVRSERAPGCAAPQRHVLGRRVDRV